LNIREAYCHHCISFEILFGFGAAGEKYLLQLCKIEMENMGPMARALERLRTKKLLNSGAMKGKYYFKWHARLK
jgi:hypothetical protein